MELRTIFFPPLLEPWPPCRLISCLTITPSPVSRPDLAPLLCYDLEWQTHCHAIPNTFLVVPRSTLHFYWFTLIHERKPEGSLFQELRTKVASCSCLFPDHTIPRPHLTQPVRTVIQIPKTMTFLSTICKQSNNALIMCLLSSSS